MENSFYYSNYYSKVYLRDILTLKERQREKAEDVCLEISKASKHHNMAKQFKGN